MTPATLNRRHDMHDDPYWLNKIMEPGHVIRVRGDGTIG